MKDFLEELLIVLVIYKMKLAASPAYHSLTNALGGENYRLSLFVYDNSPLPQTLPDDLTWSMTYVHDLSNPGVSKAYNEGFHLAKERSKKWMLLADQDTVFPSHCFDEYIKKKGAHSIVVPTLHDHVGIVSPLRFYFGGGQRVKNFGGEAIFRLQDFLFHNSGLLIATNAFAQADGYDENLPLDFSDFAFVHRLRLHHNEFALADFSCTHRLATSADASSNERLERFKSYVKAGRYYKRMYLSASWLLPLRIFFRGVKLCLKYRTYKFMIPVFDPQ
ncbi:MAG TPA: hypothetical protein VL728_02600 [Cyclobacteriaceae bacterium]|jgi:GT2 family glycosyltransferase|nr:hypothetical protein [Cyclobacteriaceae bacterium]